MIHKFVERVMGAIGFVLMMLVLAFVGFLVWNIVGGLV